MSTKAIREALELEEAYWSDYEVDCTLAGRSEEARRVRVRLDRIRLSLHEVEAVEKAARDLTRLNLGDYVYSVRNTEHVMAETPDGSSSWEHPDVTAWSDASAVLRAVAQSAPTTSTQGKK